MYELQIQTKNTVKKVENPVEPRITKSLSFSNLEVRAERGNWISIVRFFNLSYLEEEKDTEENVLNEIREAIKNRKNYIFVDV